MLQLITFNLIMTFVLLANFDVKINKSCAANNFATPPPQKKKINKICRPKSKGLYLKVLKYCLAAI